ncbi:hypothetical protein jhhlp_004757 [Lomentospora prolificans]|uniref:Uncharacterized protein n=1 Tax=Lomentospora prolificans TaxID=41688 RepID=A0A2N3N8H7_9PEZI|nr:hypothetical protein jhhlp_004757 [Lomentospora prolificans]
MAPQNPQENQQEWYGAYAAPPPGVPPPSYYQNQPPAYQQHADGPQQQSFVSRPPQWVPFTQSRREKRSWDRTHSILRQVCVALPFVMMVVIAYIYIRESTVRENMNFPANNSIWTPLYTVLPLAFANLVWSCSRMTLDTRRSHHRGKPIGPMLEFGIEFVLAAGSIACFAIIVWYLKKSSDNLSFTRPRAASINSLGWLLGLQMLSSVSLCVIAGLRAKNERKGRAQQEESYIVR